MIVTSYYVMTFTHHLDYESWVHITDSFEHMTWLMGFNWLKDIAQFTQASQLRDFTL